MTLYAAAWATFPIGRYATTSTNDTPNGEFQTVPGQKHATGQQFTTRETIVMERAIVAHMQRGQGSVEPIMAREQATAQAATREFLNPTQKNAIEEILTS